MTSIGAHSPLHLPLDAVPPFSTTFMHQLNSWNMSRNLCSLPGHFTNQSCLRHLLLTREFWHEQPREFASFWSFWCHNHRQGDVETTLKWGADLSFHQEIPHKNLIHLFIYVVIEANQNDQFAFLLSQEICLFFSLLGSSGLQRQNCSLIKANLGK